MNPYRTETYDYALPPELIAQRPADRRDASRLLVLGDGPSHHTFSELPELLRPGDLLVANDTRVLRARFLPKRSKGGAAQVLLLHPAAEPGTWEAMVRPGARVRPGDKLTLDRDSGIQILARGEDGTRIVRFYGVAVQEAMRRFGLVPLPPYIRTAPADAAERYQTVYAAHDGSVAAPTAGLHFTPALLEALRERGVGWTTITLDVGAGTFRPVSAEDIRDHRMHAERYEISEAAARSINEARREGRRVIAVGTTAARALEDAARRSPDGRVEPESRWTDLFIYPGFAFNVVDALITNFHLPRSTLLMLVCAFAGTSRILGAYEESVRERYRFYSFGDAMLLARRLERIPEL
jgi:S-adenosylmethionine:tRNA ribosyltransferase-isomerase